MLNDETYENTWDLLSSIPSIDDPAKSVRDEIIEFDTAHPTHSNARLVNKHAEVQDVTSMGFDMADRIAMSKLIMTPEEKLGTARSRIGSARISSRRISGICGRPRSHSSLGIAPPNSNDT